MGKFLEQRISQTNLANSSELTYEQLSQATQRTKQVGSQAEADLLSTSDLLN